MSYQKMMDDLKRHIDTRFDALEEKMSGAVTVQKLKQVAEDMKAAPQTIESLGLTSQQESALTVAGYVTVEDLAAASDDELLAVDGVGKRTVEFIRGRTS